jgi:hypothetical protein
MAATATLHTGEARRRARQTPKRWRAAANQATGT